MPTYKYKCRNCNSVFTVRASIKEKTDGLVLKCPDCSGKDVFQLFNSIGIIGSNSGNKNKGCSSCPPGADCCG